VVCRELPPDRHDREGERAAERPAGDEVGQPVHPEHESAETDEGGEPDTGRDERDLGGPPMCDGDREHERSGEEERSGVGCMPGGKGLEADVLGVHADRGTSPTEDRLGGGRGETGEHQGYERCCSQAEVPSPPPQPAAEEPGHDRQGDERSERAHDLGGVDEPLGAVVHEPGQDSLVVGDETAAVQDVFGDEHEQQHVGGRQDRHHDEHSA